jgi:hypothetical protein
MDGLVETILTYRNVRWLFLANALINWTVSLPGIVDPSAAAAAFGGVEPNYRSVIRLWQGFLFMFGCMFWEVSRDVGGKAALLMILIVFTNCVDTVHRMGGCSGETSESKANHLTYMPPNGEIRL